MEDAASGSTYEVRFKKILVPTDFSEGAEQALKYAVRFNGLYYVMSTHGQTGLGRILLGGTTERVISHAACPVLLLKQTRETKYAGSIP